MLARPAGLGSSPWLVTDVTRLCTFVALLPLPAPPRQRHSKAAIIVEPSVGLNRPNYTASAHLTVP